MASILPKKTLKVMQSLDSSPLAWQHPAPFIQPHTVSREELDFLGHVNNKSYLAWMEQVAWAHANTVGIDHTLQKRLNRIMAVYENCMHYHASCYEGDELLIATWVGERLGCCRRQRFFQIIRPRDAKTVFSAEATYVCIDLVKHKPHPIPEAFIAPYLSSTQTQQAG